jgi:S-adenosylmethionine decarboxylase
MEWIVDASGCDPARLSELATMQSLFARIVRELKLTPVETVWHRFPGPGGVTGMILLTESHLTCHTYPEFGTATFNLYCCNERPEWPWPARLQEELGATDVTISRVPRASSPALVSTPEHVAGPEMRKPK